jgi:uncharacterized protein YeaO (DUF488 family)
MIYLSNFATAGKDDRAVSIAAITPKGFTGIIRKDLAPKWSLVKSYKDGKITPLEYMIDYTAQLYKLDLEQVAADLEGKVLLCYCKKTQFCHRSLLGMLLHKEFGVEVEEIGGFTDGDAQIFKESGYPIKIIIEESDLTADDLIDNIVKEIMSNNGNIIGNYKKLKDVGRLHLFANQLKDY